MTDTKKNILLALLLLFLCSAIMCKLKSDEQETVSEKENSTIKSVIQKTETTPSKKVEKDTSKVSKDTSIVASGIASQDQDVVVKKEIHTKKTVKKSVTKKSSVEKKKAKKSNVSKKKPKLTFEKMEWDFGEIVEGDIVEHKFKFTNTGNAPLEIFATSATCGCTRPSFPFLDIAPGESNVIGVTYNSVSKEGDQNPEITVESNAVPKKTILKLFGTVKPKPKEEKKDTTSTKIDTSKVKQ